MAKLKRFIKFVKGCVKKKDCPGILNLDITSRCNLNCEHCYWKKTGNLKKEISLKELEKIFNEFHEKGVDAIFLTGGEPLLRIDVIRMANKIFNSVSLVSNGTIKVPEDIQRRIFVSIDGPRDIHNKIRGADVFDKIMKNIKNDKRVILTPTLSKTNYKYIDDLISIARESNVEGITFSLYTSHKADKTDPLLLDNEDIDWIIKKLREKLKENKDIVFLTPYIINLFKTKKYSDNCYLANTKSVLSFDSNMNQKKPCVMGDEVDCKTCGCIIPAVSYALGKFDIKAWLLFDRLYPERYSRN